MWWHHLGVHRKHPNGLSIVALYDSKRQLFGWQYGPTKQSWSVLASDIQENGALHIAGSDGGLLLALNEHDMHHLLDWMDHLRQTNIPRSQSLQRGSYGGQLPVVAVRAPDDTPGWDVTFNATDDYPFEHSCHLDRMTAQALHGDLCQLAEYKVFNGLTPMQGMAALRTQYQLQQTPLGVQPLDELLFAKRS